MKQLKTHSQPPMALTLAALLGLFSGAANADRILYESFENFDSSNDPIGWQTAGHPNYLRVASENDNVWSTPYGEHAMSTYSSGVGTKTVGTIPVGVGSDADGDYTVKFNISSSATMGEYRAELWVYDFWEGWVLVASTSGDTDGSKDFSYSDEISWRYNYNDWIDPDSGFSTVEGQEIQIKLMQDPNRTDWRHTPVWDNVRVDYIPDIDTSPPTVTDMADDKDGGAVAPNSVVTYTVIFSEAMDASTVDSTDFGNAGSAPVTIASVNQTDDAIFVVEVLPTDEGTLRLKINEDAVLKDVAGNTMNVSASIIQANVTITVDGTNPILLPSDIVDDQGGNSITPNTLVTYTLNFSKDMNDQSVTSADFDNAGSAPISIGAISETTSTSGIFTIQVTPSDTGTLQLRVKAGATLLAEDGGSLDTASEIVDNTTITVETVAPTLASTDIIDDAEGSLVTVGTTVTYDLFFSKDMDSLTVDASDFGNAITTSNAPFTINSVEEAAPGVFRIELTPTGTGTIKLQVNAGALLEDATGIALVTTSAIVDDTTVTVTAPINPFDTWSGGADFAYDTNGDGLDNGIAWVLGALDVNANAIDLLPTFDYTSDQDYIICTFRRSDEANEHQDTSIVVEYGTTLDASGWTTAVHDNNNVIISETDNYYSTSPGIDRVVVKLKRASLGASGRLFARLRVVQAP